MNRDIHLYMKIFIVYYYKPFLGYVALVADILTATVFKYEQFLTQ